MSAWIVSKEHIDVLVSALVKRGGFWHRGKFIDVTLANADEVGQMLWRENHKSVNYRYDRRTRTPEYHFSMRHDDTPGEIAKLTHSYDYQTCEHEEYYKSAAFSATLSILDSQSRHVADYDEAPWHI